MNMESWARFKARERRVSRDWLLGAFFGLGLGWISAGQILQYVDPSILWTIGIVAMFLASFLCPLCKRDFWRGQFGRPSAPRVE
jgi:hypothetical protein